MSKCPIEWDKTFDKDKKYIWISEKGENTCADCKSLDGKIFSGDKVPLRPHPNCKCEVKEYIQSSIVDDFLVDIANKKILYHMEKFMQKKISNQRHLNFLK